MHRFLIIILLSSVGMMGCTSTRTVEAQVAPENDPIEVVNRPVWDFNWEVLDKYLLRPTTNVYVNYVPGFVRTGLSNAANNLQEPNSAINNLLQGKFVDSFTSVGRFVINSSIGLLGVIDFADMMGIERKEEDFGETLGVWGVGTGPYVMLPALGPSDSRSFTGEVVENAVLPLAQLQNPFNVLRVVVEVLEGRAQLMQQEQLLYDSVDSYSMVKNIYFQNLNNDVYDGNPPQPEVQEENNDEIDALLEDF